MAEGRREAEWLIASCMMALTANVNRDPKKKPEPWTSDDFNPLAAGKKKRLAAPVPVPKGSLVTMVGEALKESRPVMGED